MSVSHRLPESILEAQGRADEFDDYAERILEAAEAQLREFGLRRTSLDRIAKAAGVSRVTLFRRFANRDALLGAVILRDGRRFIAEFDAALPKSGPPEDRFVVGIVTAARLLTSNSLIARLLETDPEDVLPVLTTQAEAYLSISRAYVASVLANSRDQGMAINGDVEALAEVFVRLAHSFLLSRSDLLHDEHRLEAVARSNLLPMLAGSAGN